MLFVSSRRRHTRLQGDWSSDVCSSDLPTNLCQRALSWIKQRSSISTKDRKHFQLKLRGRKTIDISLASYFLKNNKYWIIEDSMPISKMSDLQWQRILYLIVFPPMLYNDNSCKILSLWRCTGNSIDLPQHAFALSVV